jgi:hypothetical protein
MPVGLEWLLASADGSGSGMISFDESLVKQPWFNYSPNRLLWSPNGKRLVASVETGGPGLPDPVQWWTLLFELDPIERRLMLIEEHPDTGLLLGWATPGESVWIQPFDSSGPPRVLSLNDT